MSFVVFDIFDIVDIFDIIDVFDIWYTAFDCWLLTFVNWHMSFVICHLSSYILHFIFYIRNLTFNIWHLKSNFTDGFCSYHSNLKILPSQSLAIMDWRDGSASKNWNQKLKDLLKVSQDLVEFKRFARVYLSRSCQSDNFQTHADISPCPCAGVWAPASFYKYFFW